VGPALDRGRLIVLVRLILVVLASGTRVDSRRPNAEPNYNRHADDGDRSSNQCRQEPLSQ
jgi:hypothetical protein